MALEPCQRVRTSILKHKSNNPQSHRIISAMMRPCTVAARGLLRRLALCKRSSAAMLVRVHRLSHSGCRYIVGHSGHVRLRRVKPVCDSAVPVNVQREGSQTRAARSSVGGPCRPASSREGISTHAAGSFCSTAIFLVAVSLFYDGSRSLPTTRLLLHLVGCVLTLAFLVLRH